MTKNNLETELAAIKRILERERLARKEAETQLEVYSRDLFEKEQQVEIAHKEQVSQQAQLEFLTGLLAETWRQPNLKSIVANYLERTSNFMTKAHNMFVELHEDHTYHQFQYHVKKTGSSDNNELLAQYKSVLKGFDRALLFNNINNEVESQIFELTEISIEPSCFFSHCVIVPLYNIKTDTGRAIGVTVLLYKSVDDLNIIKLQTLESSRSMLSVAIERKRAEEALKQRFIELEQTNQVLEQTQQQLIQQEKLASLGQLAAGVAHEINNPVGFVLSNLDTMKEYIKDIVCITKPLKDAAISDTEALTQIREEYSSLDADFLFSDSQTILESSTQGLHRVKTIVSDLSTFSRMDNDELENISLNSVIEKSLNVVSNELKYKHNVETQLLPEARILGNEGKLQQVFINLFINAKHAMPDGGTLRILCEKHNNKIIVHVKDEGHGIKSEHLEDIFTPFFTTKAPGEGTGLGLAISYSILQQHNASVKVDTQLDKGTDFIIRFFEAF